MWCTLSLKYLLSLPVGRLCPLLHGLHTELCDSPCAGALRACSWCPCVFSATTPSTVLDRGLSVCPRPRENAVEQSQGRSYESVSCLVNKLCCMKPLRFGDCSFPWSNLIYPDWYRYPRNHGQREGPRVAKTNLTNYMKKFDKKQICLSWLFPNNLVLCHQNSLLEKIKATKKH